MLKTFAWLVIMTNIFMEITWNSACTCFLVAYYNNVFSFLEMIISLLDLELSTWTEANLRNERQGQEY